MSGKVYHVFKAKEKEERPYHKLPFNECTARLGSIDREYPAFFGHVS
jgi:hypothetical protein